MQTSHRIALLAAFLVLSAPSVRAQKPADPSGHWEGTIQIPGRELNFEIDLARDSKGKLHGTIGVPSQNEKGVPLSNIVMDGAKISFGRPDQPFNGVLSADGKSISGDYSISGFTLPFSATRTGEAHIEAAPKSPHIGKELEGTWNGTLDVGGVLKRVVLKMSNQPDGTSAGSIISLDEGGIELPITIAQQASNVTVNAKSVGSSYSGSLNSEGNELIGAFSQRGFSAPLTFRRAAASEPNR